jgi:prophage antirepressor-like protein
MDNNIVPFESEEFGTVRTLMIDNEPWFVGKDVAEILGYKESAKAIREHVDDEDKGVSKMDTPGGTQKLLTINESGLYSLIISSKLPKAKQFKRWVTSEVLPTIRKTGGYVNDEHLFVDTYFDDLPEDQKETMYNLLARIRRDKEVITKQAAAIEEMKPKATYYDVVLNCKKTVPMTLIAKDFGMSAKAMNDMLHAFHVQYKQGKTWVLYSKYQKDGYAQTVTVPYDNCGKTNFTQSLKWTQKGRYMIYEIMKKHNILPIVERV